MSVGDGGKEVVDGFRVNVGEGVTDGDGGDFGAWVERKHVSVDPCTCDGAVSGDGSDEVVGDSEEDGDVGVEERTDYGWVGLFETEVNEFEVLHGGGGESWRVYVTPIVGREVVVVGRRERRR